MQRRSFLKTSAMAGSAFLFSRKLPAAPTAADDALIEIMLGEPLGTISPLIYSHFTEELGAVIYDGVWVGENAGRGPWFAMDTVVPGVGNPLSARAG